MKTVSKSAAVDVEGFEDADNFVHVEAKFKGPLDNVEIFLTNFETIDNPIQQHPIPFKFAVENPEIATIEFHPEADPLDVFNPTSPQVTIPMVANPLFDGLIAKISAGAFTFDPLVAKDFAQAVFIDTARVMCD